MEFLVKTLMPLYNTVRVWLTQGCKETSVGYGLLTCSISLYCLNERQEVLSVIITVLVFLAHSDFLCSSLLDFLSSVYILYIIYNLSTFCISFWWRGTAVLEVKIFITEVVTATSEYFWIIVCTVFATSCFEKSLERRNKRKMYGYWLILVLASCR